MGRRVDGFSRTHIAGLVELARSDVDGNDARPQLRRAGNGAETNDATSNDGNRVRRPSSGSPCRVKADCQRLDDGQVAERHIIDGNDLLRRNRKQFGQAAFALNPQRLVVLADVGAPHQASAAHTAACIGQNDDLAAGQTRFRNSRPHGLDDSGNLMANDARIGNQGKQTAIGAEVAATKADIADPQQHVLFTQDRRFDVLEGDIANAIDAKRFHQENSRVFSEKSIPAG